MTEEELAAIEARANAATKGPWRRRDQLIGPNQDHASTEVVGNDIVMYGKVVGSTPVCKLSCGFIWFEGDCEFIPRAREDVPALIAEVRRLRSSLAEIAEAGTRPSGYDECLEWEEGRRSMAYSPEADIAREALF